MAGSPHGARCCGDEASRGPRRREVVAGLGGAVAGTMLPAMPVMAGPFEDNEYRKAIPADKKLDPQWVRSLYERGDKETYTDPKALAHIGMPVGGFFAGTLYLSGDGRLWLWDVFNQEHQGIAPRKYEPLPGIGNAPVYLSGVNFLKPPSIEQPFETGFSITTGGKTRSLDAQGFSKIEFDGRYPIGRVSYGDPDCPLRVQLEAFSPFIPLNTDDSCLPATVMSYTVHNPSERPVEFTIDGRIENPICLHSGARHAGLRRNRVVSNDGMLAVDCSAATDQGDDKPERPDIVFEDFEQDDYEGWTVEGDAFGKGPVRIQDIPDYQGQVNGRGERVVNSHASAEGDDVDLKDEKKGSLTSEPFTLNRRYIQMLVGGGSHAGTTCVNLLIGDKVVQSVTGKANNRMRPVAMNVAAHEGKRARIQIVDHHGRGWGNIGVDQIVLTDRAATPNDKLELERDFGTMTLALLGKTPGDRASAAPDQADAAAAALTESLVGRVQRTLTLEPGERAEVTFAITWRFPNFIGHGQWLRGQRLGHWYAARFKSALAVAGYVNENLSRLAGQTRRWVDTWYDSTLPYWLLDRAMANTSTLATTTCYRHENGRYWAWEGVGCCPGTCTHVWHYAQAPGRLFPATERDQRERVDFGLAFNPASGAIHYRAEVHNHHADDGQAGRVLGVYREHQMSADDGFLRRLWPNVKKAVEFMIARDGDADGILDGAQPNTLDAAWYGKVSFISSLYLAALKAGERMATEMGDDAFAKACRSIAERGATSILDTYNDEYFIQIEDPKHKDKIGIGPGCYIDQVFGQTWAHWTNLGYLFDRDKQISALRALWKYNFVPDNGPFRERFKRGRWYAAAGDAGLIMCSWPRGGQNPKFKQHWQYMYFNECMTGFEWQAAAHMIWEGHDQPELLEYGLAVSRAIHDRYNAARRNPYNEIECSDHYARAMASYGVFQAVCGFNCHGPRGHIEFAPRLAADDFKAPFTCATAWGTFTQRREGPRQAAAIRPRWGEMNLRTIGLRKLPNANAANVAVTVDARPVDATVRSANGQVTVELDEPTKIATDQTLTITLS